MPDPTDLYNYRNHVGKNFSFIITGSISGSVYGTDIYSDDSILATAAVHAGVVQNLETKNITVTILPGQSYYTGSTQNGVSSLSWSQPWGGSYSFIHCN
jgi:hypothetical protein